MMTVDLSKGLKTTEAANSVFDDGSSRKGGVVSDVVGWKGFTAWFVMEAGMTATESGNAKTRPPVDG